MKKWILILFGSLLTLTGFAQQAASGSIEMADSLRASGKIYVVVLVVAVIFAGIIIYLVNLDRKVRKLEKEMSIKEKK
jgi:CcmD family protein